MRRVLNQTLRGLYCRCGKPCGYEPERICEGASAPASSGTPTITQEAYVVEVEASRAVFQARAFEVALELMTTAKSEAVRARMAEFLATGGKAAGSVNVHVDARQMDVRGYEYVRPGQQVVDIVIVENSLGNTEPNQDNIKS